MGQRRIVIDQRMQQQGFDAGFSLRQLDPPLANQALHITVSLSEFHNLPFEGTQLFLRKVKHPPAGDAAFIADSEDFGKFGESESELQGPLNEVDALDHIGGIQPVAAGRSRRVRKDSDPLIVADGIRADASHFGNLP